MVNIPSNQVNTAQGNPYSNTYNPGWRNHPNFSYKNNNALFAPSPTPVVPPGYQKGSPAAPQAPKKSNLELTMENFIATEIQKNNEFTNQNVHTNELITKLASKVDSMATHNKMLENQILQVAQQQEATTALARIFSGQPQRNPKGHATVITLRSGTELDGPADPKI